MEQLKKLLSFPTVSGNEYMFCDQIKEIFREYTPEVTSDRIGNIIAGKNVKGAKRAILLDAHLDTIGLMVSEILPDGMIKFITVGGVDTRVLPAMSVTVCGRENIPGVIGAKPPHLMDMKDDKPYEVRDLFVDTGYTQEELKDIVSIGDIISFNSEYTELMGGRISCGGLDDRMGVYILLKVLEGLKLNNTNVITAATIGEEIGLKGAAAIDLGEIDLAVILDVTHGTTPGCIVERSFDLGGGPVVTVGTILDKNANKLLFKIANENGIRVQKEVESGNMGTNAWEYHSKKYGIPTIMISVPLRYMHTNYEVLDTTDLLDAIRLIRLFLETADKGGAIWK